MPFTKAPILKSKRRSSDVAKNNNPSPLKAANKKLTERVKELEAVIAGHDTEALAQADAKIERLEGELEAAQTAMTQAKEENDKITKELDDVKAALDAKPAAKKSKSE